MEDIFVNTCRTCFQLQPKHFLISLYEIEQTTGKMYKDILYDCTSMQIFADDYLPSVICKECRTILITSYKFKEECLLSEQKFKNILKDRQRNINLELIKSCINRENKSIHPNQNEFINNQIIIDPNEHVESLVTTYFSDEDNINESAEEEEEECTFNEPISNRINSHCVNVKKDLDEKKGKGENGNICSYCEKSFKTPYDLTVHIRRHTGTKPYVCNICNKRFVSMGCLTSHSRVHSGETPFTCKICSKSFSHSSTLYKHVQSHKKQHVCDVCQKRFTSTSCLESHKRTHSGLKPHKCKTCGKGFGEKKLLQRHYLVHVDDKPHLCNVCGNNFKRTSTLKKHLKVQHGIGKKVENGST